MGINKYEYHLILKNLNKAIDERTLNSKSAYRENSESEYIRYDSFAPTRDLLYKMTIAAEKNEEYMKVFKDWLSSGGDRKKCIIATNPFKDNFDEKYHRKYPLPFVNARDELSQLLWRL